MCTFVKEDLALVNNTNEDRSIPRTMGNYLFSSLSVAPEPIKLMLLGLDASGKTTVLYKLNHQLNGEKEVVQTIPTIGLNIETLQLRGIVFTAWDVGGRSMIRPLLARQYYKGTDAMVYVVDSNNSDRLEQARDDLHRTLNEEELVGIPLLVLCNKQDQPNALSPSELVDRLDIRSKAMNRPWSAVGCIAHRGEGLLEGIQWLSMAVQSLKAEKATFVHTEKAVVSAEKPVTKSKQADLVSLLGYDPSDTETNSTLQHFRGIQQGTQCPFAKAAKLWGGMPEEDIDETKADKVNAAALTEFVRRSNSGERLDGFCIELPNAAATPEELGVTVRRTLTALSDKDPAAEGVMRVKYIGSRGWRFRFAKADFFVTTFAPCYPASSSRYAFNTGRAFVLLQPEVSFLRHNLPIDTPVTLEPPKTIRDKTRLAFRDAGRSYHIPDTTKYPPAEHIVKPIHDDGKTIIRWWVDNGETKIDM